LFTRADHPQVQRWVRLRTDKEARREEGSLLLTSPREIEEVAGIASFRCLIVTEHFQVPVDWPSCPRVFVSERLMQKITGIPSPQGCAAELALPAESRALGPWVLVLDGVSDPGNVGTLLRSALALGWTGVWVLPGTADLWNEKVLRASKGAAFKLPVAHGSLEQFMQWRLSHPMPVWLADLEGERVHALSAPCCLVMGNEARGPSKEWSSVQRLTIPQSGAMESLNVAVAGGILMAVGRGLV
jgi:TrmH family RNA methyltransferase